MSVTSVVNSPSPIPSGWARRVLDAHARREWRVRWLRWWRGDEFWRRRRSETARQRVGSLLLAVALVALFGLLDGYIAPDARAEVRLIRFGIFTPAILVVLWMTIVRPLHRLSEVVMVLGVFVAGACLTAMTLIAPAHFAGLLVLTFGAHTFLGLRCTHAGGAGLSVSALYVVAATAEGSTAWPELVANACFLVSCNAMGGLACYMLEQAARREFRNNRELAEQQQLSERLLRNVLPAPVAERLKLHCGTIADSHSDVTILFADIVGFTSYAAAIPPARLVQTLDQVFTCFDHLAEKHGLEKIKTIGDAYMAAGGLRTREVDHVSAVAEMALDMLEAIKTFDPGNGDRLALRIGIHTGPVVAGVIGRTKFAYDLWGDTVNVASRLESLAMPETIQVGQSTYERLRDRYVFSPRQVVRVRGRGDMSCYVLLSRDRMTGTPVREVPAEVPRAATDLVPVWTAAVRADLRAGADATARGGASHER